MSFIPWVTIAICVVTMTGGLTFFIVMSRMMRKLPGGVDDGRSRVDELEQRLSALERRMTDVQDVLISLDEKHGNRLPTDSGAKEG
jgi:hypothetical protein